MSETETNEAEQSLSEQHRQWKLKVVTELHRYAEEQAWCVDFDRVLERVGLPPRERYEEGRCNDPDCCSPREERSVVTGEDTVEEHKQWKLMAARTFREAAERYGITPGWDDQLADLGFPAKTQRNVKVEGTFSILTWIDIFEGEGFIDAMSDREVRLLVQDHFYQDNVQWKVMAVDDDPDVLDRVAGEAGLHAN